MKLFQFLTTLLVLFLLALAWASWELLSREANAPAVDELALRQSLGLDITANLPPVLCPVCNGQKWVEEKCSACNGSGVYKSSLDKNSPQACPFCAGTGKIKKPCPACTGRGIQQSVKNLLPLDRSKAVSGSPVMLCPTCKGSKFVWTTETCRNCQGTGILKNRSAWSQGTTCPFCKGTGNIAKETTTACPTCQGRGLVTQAASP